MDHPRTGRLRARFRRLVFLLGWAGLVLSARPALGMGCHVDEKPVFGVTLPGDKAPSAIGVAAFEDFRPGALTPKSCTDEVPSAPGRGLGPGPAEAALSIRNCGADGSEAQFEAPRLLLARLSSDDRDRPPR